jgi:hypothetical protein
MQNLEGDDLAGLGDESGHVRRCDPLTPDSGQVVIGRPPGDGATLSDEDRHGVLLQLGEQLARRWHTYPLHRLTGAGVDQLRRIPGQQQGCGLTDFNRPVDREMNRDRGARRITSTAGREVQDVHDPSVSLVGRGVN